MISELLAPGRIGSQSGNIFRTYIVLAELADSRTNWPLTADLCLCNSAKAIYDYRSVKRGEMT